MGVYIRTSRRTGFSVPWPLAPFVLLVWATGWLVVGSVVLLVWLAVALVKVAPAVYRAAMFSAGYATGVVRFWLLPRLRHNREGHE